MTHSKQFTDLLAALCAARLAFPTITRNREGFSKRTGQKYGYADLNAIIDATEPILGAHGLLMVQAVEDGERETLRITSTLFHAASGQWLSSWMSVEKPADMQNFGMTCTYLKRYAQQALLNISTEEDDDAASLNGSHKAEKSAAADHRPPSEPVSSNGHQPSPEPDPALEHPTEGHIAALANLALTECHEDKEVYDTRIRQTMRLKPAASVAPRLLTRTMSMAQYMEIFAYYRRLESQLAQGQEATRANTSQDAPASATEAAPTEDPQAVPQPASAVGSSSAPGHDPDDAAERDRQRLRAEVASWPLRVSETEVEHILTHHPYSKARTLLWQARRPADATPIESAAD